MPGITVVGLIPDEVQQMVLYTGAVAKTSSYPAESKALLDSLSSAQGRKTLKHHGLVPIRQPL